MKESIGDKLFWIMITIFCSVIILGWIMLIGIVILQWLFPKYESRLEFFLQLISKPLAFLQKYSIYGAVILLLLRLIAGWLGWAPPLSGIDEE